MVTGKVGRTTPLKETTKNGQLIPLQGHLKLCHIHAPSTSSPGKSNLPRQTNPPILTCYAGQDYGNDSSSSNINTARISSGTCSYPTSKSSGLLTFAIPTCKTPKLASSTYHLISNSAWAILAPGRLGRVSLNSSRSCMPIFRYMQLHKL